MTRFILLGLMAMLAACSHPDPNALSSGIPGLHVAEAALSDGAPAVALSVTDGMLEKNPKDVPALLCRGDALILLNRREEAEESYRKALIVDPGSVGAQMGLGRLRLRTAPEEAQALFLDVLRKDPHNNAALNDLGITYDLQGDHTAAQTAYRKVLGADPSIRSTEVNLAVSMAMTGQAADAVKMLRTVANEPGASRRVRHDLAAALALAGDKDGASRILSQDMTEEDVGRVLRGLEAFGS
jgi:Flp pilus assembly protein TadD